MANNRREEAMEGKKWKTSRDEASSVPPLFVRCDGYVLVNVQELSLRRIPRIVFKRGVA